MTFLPKMLHVVEIALQNPTDKAAVQLAADALAVAAEAANLPSVIKFEKDYDVYRATLPKSPDAPAPATPPAPEPVSDVQRDMGDHAHGSRMDPSL